VPAQNTVRKSKIKNTGIIEKEKIHIEITYVGENEWVRKSKRKKEKIENNK
jgi:hypothetical protein